MRKYSQEVSNGATVILCRRCNEINVEEIEKEARKEERQRKVALKGETEKRQKVIIEYLTKYLVSKGWETNINIASLYQDKSKRNLFTTDAQSLVIAKEKIETDLQHLLSPSSDNHDLGQNEELSKEIERHEEYIELFDDLERLNRLFAKKGIKSDYLELITLLSSIIVGNYRANADKTLRPLFVRISNKLGENASKDEVIKEWLATTHEIGNDPLMISALLDKFNIEYDLQELEGQINRLNEEIDLEVFEKNLESPSKIKIEELSKLSGYELEKHIEAIFIQLGWDIQELQLFDNQAVDLIVTEDDETIAVRAIIGAEQVTETEVQKSVSLMKQYHADKVMVVTDSIFTNKAAEYSRHRNIDLWNGKKLKKILRNANPGVNELLLKSSTASPDQSGNLSMQCPFCESVIQIEQAKLPEQGGEHIFECPVCGIELRLSPKPESV